MTTAATDDDLDLDFSDFEIKRGKTAFYTVPHLPGPIVLETLPASASLNPAWFSDYLRSPRTSRESASNLPADEIAKRFDDDRRENRELAVRHLIRGWSGVINKRTGAPVPYSIAAARVLVGKIPDHIFDGFYHWAANEAHFTPAAIARVKAQALSGN